MASGSLMYDTGSPRQVLCEYLAGWAGEGGEGVGRARATEQKSKRMDEGGAIRQEKCRGEGKGKPHPGVEGHFEEAAPDDT